MALVVLDESADGLDSIPRVTLKKASKPEDLLVSAPSLAWGFVNCFLIFSRISLGILKPSRSFSMILDLIRSSGNLWRYSMASRTLSHSLMSVESKKFLRFLLKTAYVEGMNPQLCVNYLRLKSRNVQELLLSHELADVFDNLKVALS